MAFSSSQIRVLCSTSSPLEIEKNIYRPWKSLGFYSSGKPKIEEILDGSPASASHRSAYFFGLFLVSGRVSLG